MSNLLERFLKGEIAVKTHTAEQTEILVAKLRNVHENINIHGKKGECRTLRPDAAFFSYHISGLWYNTHTNSIGPTLSSARVDIVDYLSVFPPAPKQDTLLARFLKGEIAVTTESSAQTAHVAIVANKHYPDAKFGIDEGVSLDSTVRACQGLGIDLGPCHKGMRIYRKWGRGLVLDIAPDEKIPRHPFDEVFPDAEVLLPHGSIIPDNDEVNRPAHYTSGKIEVIDFIEDQKLDFHRGNAVKYIARAGKKDPAKEKQDLEKAVWYLKRLIEKL